MEKEIFLKFILGLVLFTILMSSKVNATAQNEIIVNSGVIKINEGAIEGKVKISKSKQSYIYEYKQNQKYPLQMGLGNYTVQILEKESENKYILIKNINILNNTSDVDGVFLESTQNINWENEKSIKNISDQFINRKSTELEKIEDLRNYILENYKYDFIKSEVVTNKYIPKLDQIVESKKGICYDFSILVASVLRYEGIKTKLIFGYNKNIENYHAWNEVYVDGKWEILDITMDLEYLDANIESNIFKDKNEYTAEKIY